MEDVQEVVCSDCGHEFLVKVVDGNFEPSTCPACEGSISALTVPPDGARTIAIVGA